MHMKHDAIASRKRKPINLSLDEAVVAEARSLGINLSRACNDALAAEVARERDQRWRDDNRQWVDDYNKWIEANPLPLERYRLF